MTTSSIEPGLLRLFRLFVGLRFGLQALALCSASARVERFPVPGLIETGVLLAYLSWPRLERWLGRAYLPLALIAASVGPIFTHALVVAARVRHGAGRLEAGSDAWTLILILFIPLVFLAWQYGFRSVVILTLGAAFLTLLLAVPLAIRGGPRVITTFGLVAVQTLLYLMAGYLIARLMAAQRVQREALARSNAQLAHYATTIERLTVSHERNRMARELHDTLAHTLSAVSVQLEATEALWDHDPAASRKSLAEAQRLTHNGLQETRRALHALRARPLEDLGLALAVRRLAEQGAARAGLTLSAEIDVDLGTLRPVVEQTVYRVAEEAITNMVRHANARALTVRLRRESGGLALAITDDGRGFDPGAARDGHYGLTGMQERAVLCGGVLDVTSQPDGGTQIRLRVETP